MIHRLTALVCLFGLTIAPQFASGQDPAAKPRFRIVGYLPNYRAKDFDPVAVKGITDLILFSGEPDKSGTLKTDRVPKIAREKFAKLNEGLEGPQRVRVILCIGGWERSKY